jgi:hypothetical protein
MLQGDFTHSVTQSHMSIYEPSPRQDNQGLLLLSESPEESVLPQTTWSPFYTPEHFTTPLEDSYPLPNDFCLPVLPTDVQNAPFQFSSSSLSAALSDPLQHNVFSSPLPNLIEDHCDPDFPSASVSPASPNNDLISNIEDQPMAMCDISTFHDSLELGRILSQVNFNSPSLHNDQALDVNGATVSPLFSPQDMSQPTALPPQGSPWTPSSPFEAFGFSPVEQPHQLHHFSSFSYEDGALDELSSTASTPIHFISPLSPASSPGAISPIDLPSNDLQTAGSLLFSPTQRPREPAMDTHRRRRMTTRRSLKPPGTGRLSANLAITSE